MNNKESLKEDIENIMHGTPTDKENGTSLIPNGRVVGELSELVIKNAIAFAKWISNHRLDFQTATNGNWIGLDMVTYTNETLYELYTKEQSINNIT